MILTIDIGNSNIVIAGMKNGQKLFADRLPTRANWSESSMSAEILAVLTKNEQDVSRIDGGILSSVVPSRNTVVEKAFFLLTGKELFLCHPDIPVKNYDTSSLGRDRLVDLTAATKLFPTPVAVFDLGTCTTLSAADKDGCFIGGMICAGIQLSLNAEAEKTEQLPSLSAQPPETLIGSDTASCMINGAVIGTAAMIDDLSSRLESELSAGSENRKLTVVLTGGLSRLVLPWLKRDVHYEPDLLLKGLEVLYRKEEERRRKPT